MYSLKEKVIGYISAAIQYVKPIVNKPIVIGATVATLIGGGSAYAVEKADNYGANLVRGTAGEVCINIPGKAVNRFVIGTGIAGYAGLKNGTNLPLIKEIPGVSNLVGLVTGAIGEASKNVTYTGLDIVENAALTVAGYKGSGPEELGEMSEKLDESKAGRIIASTSALAILGAVWAKQNGITVGHSNRVSASGSGGELEGALLLGGIGAGSQAANEIE